MMRLWLAFALLFSCTPAPLAPEEPIWGKQPCDHCAMLLSEPAPSAQAVLADGSRKFFDDIGCLAAYLAQPEVKPQAAWVHTPDGSWGDARSARFAPGHLTPMDYGYLAAPEGISFDELQRAVLAKNLQREEAR